MSKIFVAALMIMLNDQAYWSFVWLPTNDRQQALAQIYLD